MSLHHLALLIALFAPAAQPVHFQNERHAFIRGEKAVFRLATGKETGPVAFDTGGWMPARVKPVAGEARYMVDTRWLRAGDYDVRATLAKTGVVVFAIDPHAHLLLEQATGVPNHLEAHLRIRIAQWHNGRRPVRCIHLSFSLVLAARNASDFYPHMAFSTRRRGILREPATSVTADRSGRRSHRLLAATGGHRGAPHPACRRVAGAAC